jgi:hypothetical protein
VSRNTWGLLVTIVLTAGTAIGSGAQGADLPGILELATSTDTRPLLTTAEIQALLPERGQFTFPAPYNTTGVRLTNQHDCGEWYDCVNTLGGASWRNMNNSAGSNLLYIVLGLDKSNGGAGPSLFRYNKTTGDTENLGPLFEPDDDRTWSTMEGWYFSATQPTTWYQNVDHEFQRYDVLTHTTAVVFDIRDQFGDDKEIWHAHSSHDDRVHSFILRLINNYDQIGCGVYREDTHQFSYYPAQSLYLHECQVDQSGQWLLIKEDLDGLGGEDNRIVRLATGTETVLLEGQGAPGLSDNGFDGMVAADSTAALPGAVRTWTFPTTPGPVVYHGLPDQPPSFVHISFTNGRSAAFDLQYACGSAVSRTNGPRANEVVCVRLDGSLATLAVAPVMTDLDAFGGSGGPGDDDIKQPVGNLDPTGEFYLWTSNIHSDRLDAFLVRVPGQRLVTGPADVTPPTVAITLPADAATVSGDADLTATASDNVGVAGVQFKLDGVNLGAEVTSAPYAWTWHTTTTADGVHALTAVARDAAGNVTTSLPVAVTVLNTPDGPQISNVGASNIIDRMALVSWTTNQLADSQVEYGLTTAYGSTTTLDSARTAAHLQTLGGLTAGTTYHYRVLSRNAQGTIATSADFTLATAPAPVISNVTASNITSTSAAIAWTTDVFSSGQVEYGPTTDYHNATDLDDLAFAHTHALAALTPGTVYHYRVYAVTPAGVLSVSLDATFTTAVPLTIVTDVTSSAADGTYRSGSTLPIQVTFSAPVTVTGTPQLTLATGAGVAVVPYTSGSGTAALTFMYPIITNQNSADLDYVSATALVLNGGTITDGLARPATLTLPAPGAAGSLGANKNLVIDNAAPTVTNVTSPTADGAYGVGAVIPVHVTFTEPVIVTGTPQLMLWAGSNVWVNYTGGSGTATLTFTYTVAAGQASTDLNYNGSSQLSLNGGTIKDPVGNVANVTLPVWTGAGSLGANKDLVIDAVSPTVTDVNSSASNGTYDVGAAMSIQVTFSEAVTVTGTPQLLLETGAFDEHAAYTGGSGSTVLTFTYTVVAGDTSTDLSCQSTAALGLNGSSIEDAVGNDAVLTVTTSGTHSLAGHKALVIDTAPPKVTTVSSPVADSVYGVGAVIPVNVTFGKIVVVTGTPQLTLATHPNTAVNYTSGSGTATLTFTYTVAPGQSSSDLNYPASTPLALNGGTINSPLGTPATLSLPGVASSGALASNNDIIIDTTVPLVTNVTSPTANGTYGAGAVILVTVTFSENVTVTGTPQLTLAVNPDVSVSYTGGSGTNALTFTYTVAAGQSSPRLNYPSASALELNGGAIADVAGNPAVLTLPMLGTDGMLGVNKSLVIAGLAPEVSRR